jgi:hypothetical protein
MNDCADGFAIRLSTAATHVVRHFEVSRVTIARGAVIALSLVFLVNAICGIGWMH